MNALIQTPLPWYQKAWNQWYHAAKNNTLSHALLIQAPTGAGKTTLTQQFSRLLLCTAPSMQDDLYLSCDQCSSCRWHAAGSHPNYYYLNSAGDKGKTKISIEQIRELIDALHQTDTHHNAIPNALAYHTVAIIDSVDDLHITAQHALLKTLEEPAPGILFLLTSSRPASLLATIKSRCQSMILPQPNQAEGQQWLQANASIADSVSDSVSSLSLRLANHIPLKALTLLENNEIACYQSIWKDWIDLGLQLIGPREVAEKWGKQPIEKLLSYLMEATVQLLEIKLGAQNAEVRIPIQDISLLQKLISVLSEEALCNFWDQLQQLQSDMHQYSLNTLIAIESLVYTFSNSCNFSSAR